MMAQSAGKRTFDTWTMWLTRAIPELKMSAWWVRVLCIGGGYISKHSMEFAGLSKHAELCRKLCRWTVSHAWPRLCRENIWPPAQSVIHYHRSYLGQHFLLVGSQDVCPNLKRVGKNQIKWPKNIKLFLILVYNFLSTSRGEEEKRLILIRHVYKAFRCSLFTVFKIKMLKSIIACISFCFLWRSLTFL